MSYDHCAIASYGGEGCNLCVVGIKPQLATAGSRAADAVTESAPNGGFNARGCFSRAFRKKFPGAPREYRKRFMAGPA